MMSGKWLARAVFVGNSRKRQRNQREWKFRNIVGHHAMRNHRNAFAGHHSQKAKHGLSSAILLYKLINVETKPLIKFIFPFNYLIKPVSWRIKPFSPSPPVIHKGGTVDTVPRRVLQETDPG